MLAIEVSPGVASLYKCPKCGQLEEAHIVKINVKEREHDNEKRVVLQRA